MITRTDIVIYGALAAFVFAFIELIDVSVMFAGKIDQNDWPTIVGIIAVLVIAGLSAIYLIGKDGGP